MGTSRGPYYHFRPTAFETPPNIPRPPPATHTCTRTGTHLHECWIKWCFVRVLKDLPWCIRHHSSVEKSAGLKFLELSAGPRFDSSQTHVNSNQYGFEQINPQTRFLNYCFQFQKSVKLNEGVKPCRLRENLLSCNWLCAMVRRVSAYTRTQYGRWIIPLRFEETLWGSARYANTNAWRVLHDSLATKWPLQFQKTKVYRTRNTWRRTSLLIHMWKMWLDAFVYDMSAFACEFAFVYLG